MQQEVEYFLVLAVIFAVLIPYAFKFEVFNIIKGGIDALKISLFSGYILCYVLGYYLFKYDIRKDIKRYLYIITLLLFPLVSILSSYFSIKTGKPIGFYYSRYRPSTLLMAVSLFILVKDFYQTHNLPQWLKRNIESVSRFIFGIYLIHFIIQKTLLGWGIHSNFINPIIGVPFVSILVFIISYLVVYLMDKIPIIKVS